jgi:hypothetical protein
MAHQVCSPPLFFISLVHVLSHIAYGMTGVQQGIKWLTRYVWKKSLTTLTTKMNKFSHNKNDPASTPIAILSIKIKKNLCLRFVIQKL